MMLHHDGSNHQWVPGVYWDLIVTIDDATNEHYSMFFVEQEGTALSFQGVQEVMKKQPCSPRETKTCALRLPPKQRR